jgi:hypothetical protein
LAAPAAPEATSSISSGLSIFGKIVGQGKLAIFGHVEGDTAQRLEDPEAKAAMFKMADEYDRLAACNSAWEAELRSAAKNRASRRRRQKPSET